MALDSDRSFATYGQALAEMKSPPLAATGDVFWTRPNLMSGSNIPSSLINRIRDPCHLRPLACMRHRPAIISPNGINRAYDLAGDAGLVSHGPSWVNAATRFVAMGFHHILEGLDHLLFLFALIHPLPPHPSADSGGHGLHHRPFDHSDRLGLCYAPDCAVVSAADRAADRGFHPHMALENIVVLKPQHRWVITFFFGLVHASAFMGAA